MAMTLTDEDLNAIKRIVVPVMVESLDQLAQATAAGFEDVQHQINLLQSDVEGLRTDVDTLKASVNNLQAAMTYTTDKLDIIERVQSAEVQRADRHDLIFRKMSQALKTI